MFGDYLGIGAGAHGKISLRDRIVRSRRARKPQTYMQLAAVGRGIDESHTVSEADLAFEFMLNALRLVDGFETALFARRTGLALAAIEQPLAAAEAQGLLERDHAMVRPTTKGQRFLNDLLALFLPANAAPRRTIPINTSRTDTPRNA